MNKYTLYLGGILCAATLLVPGIAGARIGVGVASGKITLDEKLKPGSIYTLPPLTVLNTGDEFSEYEASVTYLENQTQIAPPESWFTFSPKVFSLEPGAAQQVEIQLEVPVKVEPGDYFAYLEGHPLKRSDNGSTSVGVAAAAKLYFTIAPANVFMGMYYKLLSYWKMYQPWTDRVAIGLGLIILLFIFKRFFNIQINRKPNNRESNVSTS